jgi:hypothetical protein
VKKSPPVVLNAWVPKTGQTQKYATGDDGDLEKGVAWPTPRFTDNNNGTVTDNLTGLIWMKNANYFGACDWGEQALIRANSLCSGTADLTDGSKAGDWRLPNIKELESLIDYSKYHPPLPAGHPFWGISPGYSEFWSSTTDLRQSNGIWIAFFDANGQTSSVPKESTLNVWCVRGGP